MASRCQFNFKGLEDFFRRVAFTLGNSPSQTEVKVISCLPINVYDLQKRVFELEHELARRGGGAAGAAGAAGAEGDGGARRRARGAQTSPRPHREVATSVSRTAGRRDVGCWCRLFRRKARPPLYPPVHASNTLSVYLNETGTRGGTPGDLSHKPALKGDQSAATPASVGGRAVAPAPRSKVNKKGSPSFSDHEYFLDVDKDNDMAYKLSSLIDNAEIIHKNGYTLYYNKSMKDRKSSENIPLYVDIENLDRSVSSDTVSKRNTQPKSKLYLNKKNRTVYTCNMFYQNKPKDNKAIKKAKRAALHQGQIQQDPNTAKMLGQIKDTLETVLCELKTNITGKFKTNREECTNTADTDYPREPAVRLRANEENVYHLERKLLRGETANIAINIKVDKTERDKLIREIYGKIDLEGSDMEAESKDNVSGNTQVVESAAIDNVSSVTCERHLSDATMSGLGALGALEADGPPSAGPWTPLRERISVTSKISWLLGKSHPYQPAAFPRTPNKPRTNFTRVVREYFKKKQNQLWGKGRFVKTVCSAAWGGKCGEEPPSSDVTACDRSAETSRRKHKTPKRPPPVVTLCG